MKLLSGFCVVIFLLVVLAFCCYFLTFYSLGSAYLKGSSFECGFTPFSSLGLSFSMPFFVVSLVFLLFDVEILLLCFYPFSFLFESSFGVLFFFILFLVLFSTLYEWLMGILMWV